jgi:hypothetical protein
MAMFSFSMALIVPLLHQQDVGLHVRLPPRLRVARRDLPLQVGRDHTPVVVGDKDGFFGVFELRADEGRVARRRPRPRCKEAPRVEVVMLLDEERAEEADPRQVGGRRARDDGACL